MNHCINKQRHQWKVRFGILVECDACGRIKVFKNTLKGGKHARGAFGR